MCIEKCEVLGSENTIKLLSIMPISDPQITLNRSGCVKKNDRNEIKSSEYWDKFPLSLKNKCMDKSKNLCLFKIGVWGYRNLQKMIRNQVRIRSTDHFKQIG